MSSEDYYLLHLTRSSWRLCGAESELGGELSEAAAPENAAALANSKSPLVLGLASSWCLTATIDVAAPQMFRKPQLLHYELEQWIPWSAEEYVTDYVRHPRAACSIALRHEELAPLLDHLEAEGVRIAAIVPTVLMGMASLDCKDLSAICWQEGEDLDLLLLAQGQLYRWRRLSARASELVRELQVLQLVGGRDGEIGACQLDSELIEALLDAGFQVRELEAGTQLQSATQCSREILAGNLEPPVNLRKDALAGEKHRVLGKESGRLKLAVALLLLALSVSLWHRSLQYEEATGELNVQLAGIYQALFPEQEVPERVASAITKEYRQLQGTRSTGKDLPQPVAVDLLLQRLLQNLPADLRFRLPEIRIEQERLTLSGEVRSNADADRIASALRAGGFEIEPPRLQRLADQGFSVRLQGRLEENRD